MLKPSSISAVAALGLLAAGCNGQGLTVVRPVTHDYAYTPQFVNDLAQYGAVPTEVVGNPFDARKERLDEVVTQTVRTAHFGQDLDFTTTPPADSLSPYRLVVLFNPARNARPERLCSDSNQPTAAAEDRVAVMMAFCSSDYRISSTVGSRGGVSGVEDPGFRDLLAGTVTVLLPPQRYDINSPEGRRRS